MGTIPKKRQELLKWNGWGYQDSGFVMNNEGILEFTGDRYPIGKLKLPYFTEWCKENLGIDVTKFTKSIPLPPPDKFSTPNVHSDFVKALENAGISFSTDCYDRLFRSHGHTLHDIYNLRTGQFPKLPDIVIWPVNHNEVVTLVNFAKQHNVAIIPFGGGTSVSGALSCPEKETRTIMSLDTSQMNKILWIDPDNLTCCAESGIVGQDLESKLREKGYTTGHEPDSYEFSSLGGWVATRASGMKKNTYGNIEDLLVHVKMVTPQGVLEKHVQVPRISAGPDVHHVILGSEGNFGVVTEVVLKIRPCPPFKKYGSVVFPDFASGVACLREIARQRCQPSSVRLMDNEQFKFGHSLRAETGFLGAVKEKIKSIYLTMFKGFDLNQVCVATLLFEGTREEVLLQEKRIYSIAKRFGGMNAGEKNGERGYILTFVIAYIRDMGLDMYQVAESFETSVPWSHTYQLCENVKARVAHECRARKLPYYFVTCRVTQTYDVGACVYFYFAFNHFGLDDPVQMFEDIESIARDEILANKGSISHHHGIGKIRKKWISKTISVPAVNTLVSLKKAIDPENIFASGNILTELGDETDGHVQLSSKL